MKTKCCSFLYAFLIVATTVPVGAQTWNLAGGGSWNTAGNWAPATVPNSTGALVVFNSAASPGGNPAQTANRTITADGAQTVGLILFNNDAANLFTTSITTGNGGSLTFDNFDAGPATITLPNAIGTGNNTISAAMILTDSLVANVNNIAASSAAGALNLTATISGPGGFTKQGDGLATFGTGAKTYTGPTVLNGGRMRMSLAAHPTATSGLTANSNAQLTLISSGSYTFGTNPVHLNGAGPTNGPFAAFPGALRQDSSLSVDIVNPIILDSDTVIHVQGGLLSLSNLVSGPGKLIIAALPHDANLGTLTLSSNNTYSGGTQLRGGTLTFNGSSLPSPRARLGSGNVTVESANAAFAGATAVLSISLNCNVIDDNATLSLAGGKTPGVADDGCVALLGGINEVVGGLFLAGVPQPYGTYGSSSSSATFKNDEYFAGTGILTVIPPTKLSIARSMANVVISWPTNAADFVLQQTAALALTTNLWTNVTNQVVLSGTNNSVTFTSPQDKNFFRLKK
ncbi:MAG TPA: autotransporter-associated beta strand repeat-containing protein [Verrucomicrobiae bacterium]